MTRFKWVILFSSFVGMVMVGGYLFFAYGTSNTIRELISEARLKYPGDPVEALTAYVDDDTRSMKKRNRAIWALSQISDQRALPVLEKHYVGGECNHSRMVCQYELEKAIRSSKRDAQRTGRWPWTFYPQGKL